MAKIYKRGEKWYAWVAGKRHSLGTTNKEVAKKKLVQLELEAVDPDHSAQAKALTVDLLDANLLALARKERSAATQQYSKQKGGHLRRLLPDLAKDINHRVLCGYIDQRRTEGACNATISKELGVLRSALKLARRNKLFAGDISAVMPELAVDSKPRKRFVTPWELVALCNTLPPYRAAHVAFIVATSARWGESVRARREDIDLAKGFVHLRGTKTETSERDVPIIWLFERALMWALGRAAAEGTLFKPWINVRNDLRWACDRVGIPRLSPNDLRRTHATWLRQAGVDPQLIALCLGHKDSRMVERVYGRLPSGDLARLLVERTGADPMAEQEVPEGADPEDDAAPEGELCVSCEPVDLGV